MSRRRKNDEDAAAFAAAHEVLASLAAAASAAERANEIVAAPVQSIMIPVSASPASPAHSALPPTAPVDVGLPRKRGRPRIKPRDETEDAVEVSTSVKRESDNSCSDFSEDEGEQPVHDLTSLSAKIRHAFRVHYANSRVQVHLKSNVSNSTDDLPGKGDRFYCPIVGCDKTFKNPEGLIYHGRNFFHNPQPFLAGLFSAAEIDAAMSSADSSRPVRRELIVSFYDPIRRIIPFVMTTGGTEARRDRKQVGKRAAVPVPVVVNSPESPNSIEASEVTNGRVMRRRKARPAPGVLAKQVLLLSDEDEEPPAPTTTKSKRGKKAKKNNDHVQSASDVESNDGENEEEEEEEDEEPQSDKESKRRSSRTKSEFKVLSSISTSGAVLTSWMPKLSAIELLSPQESLEYWPHPPPFSVQRSGSAKKEWLPFEAEVDCDQKGFAFFCASTVRALAWRGRKQGQDEVDLLAVAGYQPPLLAAPVPKAGTPNDKNIVTFWNVPLKKPATLAPSIAYVWALETGPVWAMRWCPNTISPPPTEQEVMRAGLIAIITGDGILRIAAAPEPDELRRKRKIKDNHGILFVRLPIVWRTSLMHHPLYSFDWCGSCETIVAGSYTGIVAVWNLNKAMELGETSPVCVIPTAGSNCVESVSISPLQPKHVAIATENGVVSVFDWRDPVDPILSYRMRCNIPCVKWSKYGFLLFSEQHMLTMVYPTLNDSVSEVWKNRQLIHHHGPIMSIDISDKGVAVSCGADGVVNLARSFVPSRKPRKWEEMMSTVALDFNPARPIDPVASVFVRIKAIKQPDDHPSSSFVMFNGSGRLFPDAVSLLVVSVSNCADWLAVSGATGLVHIRAFK